MKSWLLIPFVGLLLTGCATSTVETRKQERYRNYAALSREHKVAVDMGRVTFGMNTNAAYLAWGKPSMVEVNGTAQTWFYYGSEQRRHTSSTVRIQAANGTFATETSPVLEETSTPYPHHVVQARITFQDGLVTEWLRRDRRSLEEDYLEHRR